MQCLPGDILREIRRRLDEPTVWLLYQTCRRFSTACVPCVSLTSVSLIEWFRDRGHSTLTGNLIQNSDLGVKQWVRERFKHIYTDTLASHQWGNVKPHTTSISDLTTLRWNISRGFKYTYSTGATAAYEGNFAIVQFLGITNSVEIHLGAAQYGLLMAQWVRQHSENAYSEFELAASEKNHLSTVQWSWRDGANLRYYKNSTWCPTLLQWALNRTRMDLQCVALNAMSNKNFELLQWTDEMKNAAAASYMCRIAMMSDVLVVAQWACISQRQIPTACTRAAARGYFSTAQWGHQRGGKWEKCPVHMESNLLSLKWARCRGCQSPPSHNLILAIYASVLGILITLTLVSSLRGA